MKTKSLYSSLLLSTFLLTACNTNLEEVPETSASPEPLTEEVQPTTPVEQAPPTEQTVPNETEPDSEIQIQEEPNETPNGQIQPPLQPQDVVSQPTTEFITSASTALNYTIQHLKNYTLVEEEPGKDMLFYNDNEALSMRIEVFDSATSSFESVDAIVQQAMASIAPNNTYKPFDVAPYLDTAKRTDIKMSASYIVQYESDKVTAIVYEIENKIVVLTIFDDYITNITHEFIAAGLTIQS